MRAHSDGVGKIQTTVLSIRYLFSFSSNVGDELASRIGWVKYRLMQMANYVDEQSPLCQARIASVGAPNQINNNESIDTNR